MEGNEKAPAQGPAEARDYSHSYLIKLRRGEQAELAQLTRIHRLAVLINHRCIDQEVEIRISKGKMEVTLYEILTMLYEAASYSELFFVIFDILRVWLFIAVYIVVAVIALRQVSRDKR